MWIDSGPLSRLDSIASRVPKLNWSFQNRKLYSVPVSDKFARMSCPKFGALLVSAFLLWAVVPSLSAQPEVASGGLKQLDLGFDVKPGFRVHVLNPYGNVRIREVPLAATAELRVTVQSREGRDVQARIIEDHSKNSVSLSIAGGGSRLDLDEDFLRADFVLAVPDSVELDVELERGDFTMHSATYPLRVRAHSGRLNLRTTGRVDVEVTDGHVIYNPGPKGNIHGGRIQTSAAPVDVLMRGPAMIDFSVISGAAVTTDSLPLLQRRSRDGRKTTFLGSGSGALLEIQTDAAPVRLVVHGIR